MKNTIANTSAVAYGTAGGAGFVLWIIACIQAHHIVAPDQEVAMFIAASIAPACHLVYRAFEAWLTRNIPDAEGEGGAAP